MRCASHPPCSATSRGTAQQTTAPLNDGGGGGCWPPGTGPDGPGDVSDLSCKIMGKSSVNMDIYGNRLGKSSEKWDLMGIYNEIKHV